MDFRSPALDLDSVYERGPADQPYLYDKAPTDADGFAPTRLRTGAPLDAAGAEVGTKFDLFRIPADDQSPLERPGIPILGDKRNDENKIVSQMHGVIMALHNRIVSDKDLIARSGGNIADAGSVFDKAAQLTRWHYQLVVLYDYITRVCEPNILNEYLPGDGGVRLPDYRKTDMQYAYMPVEFAVAAFRFGHSMVRPSYALNRATGTDHELPRIRLFDDAPGIQNLNGFPGTVPATWGIDWGYFLHDLSPSVPDGPDYKGPKYQVPQPSYRMDALLSDPLSLLPEFRGKQDMFRNLAFRNLQRGQDVPPGTGMPSGEALSRLLLKDVSVPADQIWTAGSRLAKTKPPADPKDAKDLADTTEARQKVYRAWVAEDGRLKDNTPLWYYILREAEWYGVSKDENEAGVAFGGQHLGPVGSRIVAQTLVGLLDLDKNSVLHAPAGFVPIADIAPAGRTSATLAGLVRYALGG